MSHLTTLCNLSYTELLTHCEHIRHAREAHRFVANQIPFTPIPLVVDLYNRIPVFSVFTVDINIAVLYTIEAVTFLLWRGYKNITIVTEEYDETIQQFADAYELQYRLLGTLHMKEFDVIISNPPYEDPTNDGVKLYRTFIVKGLELLKEGGVLAYITPNTWLGWNDETLKGVRSRCMSIDYIDARSSFIKNTYFPTVNSTFCWFLVSNQPQDASVVVQYDTEQVNIDINTLGFVPVEGYMGISDVATTISIITKIRADTHTLPLQLTTTGGHGTRVTHTPAPTDVCTVPCYCSTVDDNNLHYVTAETPQHHTKKVFVVSSYFNNRNIRRSRYVSTPCSNMNNIAYVIVSNDDEGLMSKPFLILTCLDFSSV